MENKSKGIDNQRKGKGKEVDREEDGEMTSGFMQEQQWTQNCKK